MSSSHDSTAVRVTRQIRQDIIAGELASGERLTEKSLAERYGVSRIPVRESLRVLESEGLVETRPFAGASVASLPEEDAADLFAIRIALEGATARRSADRAAAQLNSGTPNEQWWETRKEIAGVLDEGDECIRSGDLTSLAGLNMSFHALVAQLCGSASLYALFKQISGRLEWLYAANVTTRGKQAWHEHRLLIAAIDGGNSEEAERKMRAHVEQSRDAYFAHLQERAAQ